MSLAEASRRLGLSGSGPLTRTATSRLWTAIDLTGQAVVVKRLTPYGADELTGAGLMQWLDGAGAARVLAIFGRTIVLEHLPGPPLGDLVRAGHDRAAAEALAGVAAAISAVRRPQPAGLTPLAVHLAAVFRLAPDRLPPSGRAAWVRARALAAELLAAASPARPLHGDLHHDNVLGSARGWCAIDAKGLIGDPAYEPANAFRNPFDRQVLARDPARIGLLADVFAARLDLPRQRLLDWAAAQCAVSLAWDLAAGNDLGDDLALLPVLIACRGG